MSKNYEIHWSRTFYYRSVINATSMEDAVKQQKAILDNSNNWEKFGDDDEVTYHQLEWVDESHATIQQQEQFDLMMFDQYEELKA